jgi:hypothetical protein
MKKMIILALIAAVIIIGTQVYSMMTAVTDIVIFWNIVSLIYLYAIISLLSVWLLFKAESNRKFQLIWLVLIIFIPFLCGLLYFFKFWMEKEVEGL